MTAARMTGWILSVLLVGFLCFSASGKLFIDFPDKEKMFAHFGWTLQGMKTVGILEIAFALIFLLPRLGFWGAILLTAYLGGAVTTHMRIGDAWFFPIIIGVLVWVAYGLRQPEVFRLALGARPGVSSQTRDGVQHAENHPVPLVQ